MLSAFLTLLTESEEAEWQRIQARFGKNHRWGEGIRTEGLERPLLIAGLGNPGAWFANTRHNLGYLAIDELGSKYGTQLHLDSGYCAFTGRCKIQGRDALLVKPNTFVNRSGIAISRLLLDHPLFKAQEPDLLIIVDDVSIPLGELRLRAQGSSGGHNGLKSMELCLGTKHYSRLRLGLGGPRKGRLSMHVIGAFTLQELQTVKRACGKAVRATEVFVQYRMMQAMSVVNAPSFAGAVFAKE